MQWSADMKKQKAESELGYVITWAKNRHGVWYNAYTPEHRHIEAGYGDEGKKKCMKACRLHAVGE